MSKEILYNAYRNYIINNPVEFTDKGNNIRIMTYKINQLALINSAEI